MEWFKRKNKIRRYKNTIRKLGKLSRLRWKKGLEEKKRKVEWLGRKLRGNKEKKSKEERDLCDESM